MSYSFGPVNPHAERARVLFGLKRYAEAEQSIRQALALFPEDADLHAELAYCLHALGRSSEAKHEARHAIGLMPGDGYAYSVLSVACYELGEFAASLQAICEALRLEPNNAEYHQVAANIYLNFGYVEDALTTADAGLHCDPRHVKCANVRARALMELGRRDEARETLERALADNPEYYRTHENRGRLELVRGDVPAALKYFREALRLNPNNETARRGLVEALKSRNFFYRTLLWLYECNEPEGTSPWYTRGMLVSGSVGAIVGIPCGIAAYLDDPQLSVFLTAIGTAMFGAMIFVWVLYILSMMAFHWYGQAFFSVLLLADQAGRRTLSEKEAFWAKVLLVEAIVCVMLLVPAFGMRQGILAVAAVAAGLVSIWSARRLNRYE
jgi:tetratricopeptide (TPR) repeat protein